MIKAGVFSTSATETPTETATEVILKPDNSLSEQEKESLFNQYVQKAEEFDLEYISNTEKENLLDSVKHYYHLAIELKESKEIRERLKGL